MITPSLKRCLIEQRAKRLTIEQALTMFQAYKEPLKKTFSEVYVISRCDRLFDKISHNLYFLKNNEVTDFADPQLTKDKLIKIYECLLQNKSSIEANLKLSDPNAPYRMSHGIKKEYPITFFS